MDTQLKKIGRYEIIEKIGGGGMGVVYKGIDPYIGRTLAIKIIRLDPGTNEKDLNKFKKSFINEAKVAGNLSHKNIVTIYDVGEESELIFLVMEYIEGKDLRSFLDAKTKFSLTEIKHLMEQICSALEYSHSQGVIHCDVKPENIIIDTNGNITVVDFGISRSSTVTLTNTLLLVGTPSCMSPEQLRGETIDTRSDIFALGTVLYEICTGKKPFTGDNVSAIINKVINEDPQDATSLNPDLPEAFNYILRKAMAKIPDKRYKNCDAFLYDIINYKTLDTKNPFDTNKTELLPGNVLKNKKKPNILILATLILLLFSVTGLWLYQNKTGNIPFISQLQQKHNKSMYETDSNTVSIPSTDQFSLPLSPTAEKTILNNNEPTIENISDKTISKINKDSYLTHFELGMTYYDNGSYSQAISEFQTAILINPEHEESKKLLEDSSMRLKRLQQKDKNEAEFDKFYSAGVKAFNDQKYLTAVNSLNKALLLKPDDDESRKLLEQSDFQLKKLREKEKKQKEFNGYYSTGTGYFNKGEYTKAIDLFKKALLVFPGNTKAKNYINLSTTNLKKIEARKKQEEKTKEAFSKGLQLFKDGDYSGAISWFNKVLELNPKHTEAKQYLDIAYIKEMDRKINTQDIIDKEESILPEGF